MEEFRVDRDSGQHTGPFHMINDEHRFFTCEDTAIVTPNSDTPSSMLWLDLRAEPMVVSVPDVDASRCRSVQLVGGKTCTYGYDGSIGSRTTASTAGRSLVVGPIRGLFEWIDRSGPAPELHARIAGIDIADMIATARLELEHLYGYRFTDVFTLLKTDGTWTITCTVFHLHA